MLNIFGMSGGKEKKTSRSNKTQGWEEAGAEFYQESYPGETAESFHRDPSKLATLLPSKQTRVGELKSHGGVDKINVNKSIFREVWPAINARIIFFLQQQIVALAKPNRNSRRRVVETARWQPRGPLGAARSTRKFRWPRCRTCRRISSMKVKRGRKSERLKRCRCQWHRNASWKVHFRWVSTLR